MNLNFEIVQERESFIASTSRFKINYSALSIETDALRVQPHGLLSELEIKEFSVSTGEWSGVPVLFFINESEPVPFDIFSATFYLLSRYEEYLPGARDAHDRYASSQSILSALQCLNKPIIDIWCMKLHEILTGEKELTRNYSYVSTVDVDNAYAYNFKSFPIKLASTMKAIFRADSDDLVRRFGCYFRKKKDPYNTYEFIHEVHTGANVNSAYFFLLSDRNEWDKNLRHSNKYLRELINSLQRQNQIGIHPGYHSYKNADVILKEKLRLEDISSHEITQSRQHFLKFVFPETPRALLSSGIRQDYSLGYAEQLGFRAGTCTSFPFFDLEKNQVTELIFHPSALMDATLNRYLGLSPETAISKAAELINEVKEVRGEFISIWHNETLSEIREWKGWSAVFKEIVYQAKP